MWIVQLALRRPYTFFVMAMLIAVLGVTSILTMPKDIFPVIDIPVVSAIWSYGGLAPDEMQNRITTVVERAMTTTVNDIEHIESQSLRGISIIKAYFQPGASVSAAVAQVNAISETLLRPLPSAPARSSSSRRHTGEEFLQLETGVAVGAVWCEPVSGPKSLIHRENTGKLLRSGPSGVANVSDSAPSRGPGGRVP